MSIKVRNLVWYIGAILLMICFILTFGRLIKRITGYTLAVVCESPYEKIAHKYRNIKEIKLYADDRQILQQLAYDKVDAVIADRLAVLNIMTEDGYYNLKLTGDLLNRQPCRAVFNREDKALRQAVNRGLKEIIDEGVYAEISMKYFGCNIMKGVEYQVSHPFEPLSRDDSWNRVKRAGWIILAFHGNHPFSYYDHRNELAGFDAEIARMVCERLGVKFIPVIIDNDQIIEGLKTKQYDGIWSGMVIPEEKPTGLDFSDPYYITGAQLIVRDDSPITGPESLGESILSKPFSFPFRF